VQIIVIKGLSSRGFFNLRFKIIIEVLLCAVPGCLLFTNVIVEWGCLWELVACLNDNYLL